MSRNAYEITRLAFAEVVQYRRILEELKKEQAFRRISYEPARQAVISYHESGGDVEILEEAIIQARDEEDQASEPEQAVQPRNIAEVLTVYLQHFATPFRPAEGEVPAEFQSYDAEIEGLRITGKPHLAVQNQRGRTKYLYILTSKEWNDSQKNFFIGLLGEILAANVEGAEPRDLEGLDCRTGRKIIRNGLGRNFRQRVEFIAEDLVLRKLD